MSNQDTAPAFQFYSRDWLASSSVRRMTLAERGAYIDLLAFAWRDGGIPDDETELARLLQVSPRSWRRMAPRLLAEFSETADGLRMSPRPERERAKRKLWREKSARGGAKSVTKRQPNGNQTATNAQPNDKQTATLRTAYCVPRTAEKSGSDSAEAERAPTLIDEWVSRWETVYQGERFVVRGAQHGAGLKRLEKHLGRAELLARMDRYLAGGDDFHAERRHDLGVFIAQINQFVAPAGVVDQAPRDVAAEVADYKAWRAECDARHGGAWSTKRNHDQRLARRPDEVVEAAEG